MNIPNILSVIRPGAQWTLNGDTYEGLIWLDSTQLKPTEAEVIAAWSETQSASAKVVFNAPIISQIILLEAKWFRPFRDGETAKANAIRDQIIALRAKLKK